MVQRGSRGTGRWPTDVAAAGRRRRRLRQVQVRQRTILFSSTSNLTISLRLSFDYSQLRHLKQRSHYSSHLIWSHLMWPHFIRTECAVTQFAVAATNRGAPSQFRWNEDSVAGPFLWRQVKARSSSLQWIEQFEFHVPATATPPTGNDVITVTSSSTPLPLDISLRSRDLASRDRVLGSCVRLSAS